MEQQRLREATERYFDALPPSHRELICLMAADYEKPPYALIAGAIEAMIVQWKADFLPLEAQRRERRLA